MSFSAFGLLLERWSSVRVLRLRRLALPDSLS